MPECKPPPVRAAWTDDVDAILAGDLTAVLGVVTPAGGVVLGPVAPIGLRDRDAATVSFTTSRGFGRKLDRIAADPRVALAFHTREHGACGLPGFVLVQGSARVEETDEARREELGEQAARYLGPLKRGRFWDRWLEAYYADRVVVHVDVARLQARGPSPAAALARPGELARPAPQSPPPKGTAARVDVRRVARDLRYPHRLLAWRGAEGYPEIVRLARFSPRDDHLVVRADPAALPPGGRRATVLAHHYRPQLVGLHERYSLGWLEAAGAGVGEGEGAFFPHTRGGFTAPPSKTALLLANGYLARRNRRRAGREREARPQ